MFTLSTAVVATRANARASSARARHVARAMESETTPKVAPPAAANATSTTITSDGKMPMPTPVPEIAPAFGFREAFAFSAPAKANWMGSGPEVMNGRLAMLGFFSAVGSELASGETVGEQFASAPAIIILSIIAVTAGSVIQFTKNAKPQTVGPLTPAVEQLNGRAAMVGLAALLAIEAVKGSALF